MPAIPLRQVSARSGAAVRVAQGHTIKIINTKGTQVVDFWTLNDANPEESLSMAHTHGALCRVTPRVNDTMYSNLSRPMMILTEDTSAGVHDTLISPCDAGRYKLLGAEGPHPSCTDNYKIALQQYGSVSSQIMDRTPPAPLNLFMNVKIESDGQLTFGAPVSEAGQYVCLKMLMDSIVIMSACPMDLRATNNWNPSEFNYIVLG
ncbi:uncharacterized protein KY384_004950 [Bacidia gigantensis]|uniref:uncharacterized protein n=1 Tax=Bacidia gigantensis TaxID=2732470 RepID=UPI001D043FEB|nr:uncharacterized protein KY384_004950 [Bacidia gigantensis]KAG8530448.1 hypothetical protein KY384_004950 [Bacidia gigantensis]